MAQKRYTPEQSYLARTVPAPAPPTELLGEGAPGLTRALRRPGRARRDGRLAVVGSAVGCSGNHELPLTDTEVTS